MRFAQSRRALVGGALTLAVVVSACNNTPPAPAPAADPAAPAAPAVSQVERGRMLIIGGGCHDCHTPKKMTPAGPEADMDRSLSGHPQDKVITAPFKGSAGPWSTHTSDDLTAWSGAWGVSFAANLTPDENTGIGVWTEEMFMTALKTGKHMGRGRQILPPMPWNYYGQLPDDDLKAMFAYLKSITPVSNRVPVPLGPDGKPVEEP
jgi:mono/diheme cytochrome c family protein